MCLYPRTGIMRNGKIEMVKKRTTEEYLWRYADNEEFKKKIILIKCGKCKECIKNKIAELSKRIKREAKFWKENTIATLTFNEDNKKEAFEQVEEEWQKFAKRIRKKYKIRYFIAIEKGEKTERLHIHAIIFNYYPEDSEFYKRTKKGTNQEYSKELNKFWGNGLVTHEKLNAQSINYVLKYMFKQNKAKFFWSKKPPLGISENENLEELELKIKNGEQLPKCYKDYAERKLNKKIELTKYAKYMKDRIEEERKLNIEKQSKMNFRDYIQKRLNNLTT